MVHVVDVEMRGNVEHEALEAKREEKQNARPTDVVRLEEHRSRNLFIVGICPPPVHGRTADARNFAERHVHVHQNHELGDIFYTLGFGIEVVLHLVYIHRLRSENLQLGQISHDTLHESPCLGTVRLDRIVLLYLLLDCLIGLLRSIHCLQVIIQNLPDGTIMVIGQVLHRPHAGWVGRARLQALVVRPGLRVQRVVGRAALAKTEKRRPLHRVVGVTSALLGQADLCGFLGTADGRPNTASAQALAGRRRRSTDQL
mmetsp:Transcript_122093/g.317218  ORF Transcript_122093/g.317218 Transcript_122093/m.317218 type:complete len:257 (-) Transcript_122093:36-806(-)